MKKFLIILLASMFLIAGCQHQEEEIDLPDLLPFSEDSEGNLIHLSSGMEFPILIGEFIGGDYRIYSEEGDDVSRAYYYLPVDNVITLYVYPATRSIEDEFNEVKDVALLFRDGAEILSEGSLDKNNGKFVSFKYFGNFFGVEEDIESAAYVYETLGWFVKIRVTFPAEHSELMNEKLNGFVAELPFPKEERN